MLFYFPEIAGNYFMKRKMKMYFWPVFALVATVNKINITQINKQSCGVVQIATTRLKFTMTFYLNSEVVVFTTTTREVFTCVTKIDCFCT